MKSSLRLRYSSAGDDCMLRRSRMIGLDAGRPFLIVSDFQAGRVHHVQLSCECEGQARVNGLNPYPSGILIRSLIDAKPDASGVWAVAARMRLCVWECVEVDVRIPYVGAHWRAAK